MYEYMVKIDRVVDGDTVDVLIDLGFDVNVFQRVQIAGIDTPEVRTLDLREKEFGKMASDRVMQLLPVGGKFKVISKSYNSTGKYGRCMLDFELEDGRMITDVLIQEHHAVAYYGQNKAEIRAAHEENWDHLEGA